MPRTSTTPPTPAPHAIGGIAYNLIHDLALRTTGRPPIIRSATNIQIRDGVNNDPLITFTDTRIYYYFRGQTPATSRLVGFMDFFAEGMNVADNYLGDYWPWPIHTRIDPETGRPAEGGWYDINLHNSAWVKIPQIIRLYFLR